MAFRVSLAGTLTGALLGGIGRAVVAMMHVAFLTRDTAPAVVAAAVLGVIIGALAGMAGRPLLGAIIGGVLSALVYLGTLPIVLFFQSLGALRTPSMLEVVVVGAVAGALGGAAERMVARRRPT